MAIYAGLIDRNHIQMLTSVPPQILVSRAVQYLKGKSFHKLLSEYIGICVEMLGPAFMGKRLLDCVES